MKTSAVITIVASLALSPVGFAKRTPAPKNAKSYIVSPKNGATLKSPVKVIFGLSGMGVAPAGVKLPKTGHHHLMINAKKQPNMNLPFPKNEQHIHYGGGQTEDVLDLPPGKHTLQLVLADHAHIPHEPSIVSEVITITVKK